MKQDKDKGKQLIRNSTAGFLIFTGQAGEQSIEARYEDETIWLTLKLIATLFSVSIPTINEHLKNIFDSGELVPDSVIRKFRITAADSKSYTTTHYNLDAIISVGYRVNSVRAMLGMPAVFARPAASRSRHIASPKIALRWFNNQAAGSRSPAFSHS